VNPQRRRWLAQLSALAATATRANGASTAAKAAAAAAAITAAKASAATAAARSPAGAASADPALPLDDAADPVRRGRALVFPRDHGAHPGSRIEWWYATGWVAEEGAGQTQAHAQAVIASRPPLPPPDDARLIGFQLTFFRIRTGLGAGLQGRFVPRQLLFAHAALSEIGPRRHRHAERLARWSGAEDPALRARALRADADVAVGGWTLRREPGALIAAPLTSNAIATSTSTSTATMPATASPQEPGGAVWRTAIAGDDFGFDLALRRTQAVLLQGDAGFSRKGPQEAQASHYLSEPQLAVAGRLRLSGSAASSLAHASTEGAPSAGAVAAASTAAAARAVSVQGCAWLDQEWSDELLHPEAVGWDWIGINLFDGSALTAFRLRRADGSALWAGGSFRAPGQAPRPLGPTQVTFTPGRRWRSPASDADYPVEWRVDTPTGRFTVQALMDAQEIGGRTATGTVYWEGLSALVDAAGRRVGLGYLEMTGYAGRLVLPG
jgi:predicted secreted hydrolase